MFYLDNQFNVVPNILFFFQQLQTIANLSTSKCHILFAVPTQMSILLKEHFNRWYSLKAFYIALTVIDIPISILSCVLFSSIVYFMSSQPLDIVRFLMFLSISMLILFLGQGTGLMIGAICNVVVSINKNHIYINS